MNSADQTRYLGQLTKKLLEESKGKDMQPAETGALRKILHVHKSRYYINDGPLAPDASSVAVFACDDITTNLCQIRLFLITATLSHYFLQLMEILVLVIMMNTTFKKYIYPFISFFFLNDAAPPKISPLSLHDALPI